MMVKGARTMSNDLGVGALRAVMLRGGRGARLVLRRTFPRTPVDAPGLDLAHEMPGVERAHALGANWVFLTYAWGLPPEEDAPDREAFGRVVQAYHRAGIQVAAGVETSTYVPRGSYAAASWKACDPWGQPIARQTGLAAACWQDEAWIDTVRAHLLAALDAGADGVWLGTPWYGGVPGVFGGGLLGAAGCHCAHCKVAFAEAAGAEGLPRGLNLNNSGVQRYLQWRADVTAGRIREWAEAVRAAHPAALIALEGPPAHGALTAIRYGLDPAALPEAVDLFLLRDEMLAGGDPARQAVALGMARARAGARIRIGSLLGDRGDASGAPHSAREMAAAAGEASAAGCPPVIDGSQYVFRRSLTLLVDAHFAALRESLADLYGWLEANAAWLGARHEASPLAIYCPPMWTFWKGAPVEPLVEAASAAIVARGLPLRLVGEGDWDGVKALVVPPGQVPGLDDRLAAFAAAGGRVIALQQTRSGAVGRPLWTAYRPLRRRWIHLPLVRRAANRFVARAQRWHHGGRVRRIAARRLRLPDASAEVAVSALPPQALQQDLAEAIGADFRPRVRAADPALFTIWRAADGGMQWHLVTLSGVQQRVALDASALLDGRVCAPELTEETRVFGTNIALTIETVKVLRLPAPEDENAGAEAPAAPNE